MQPAMPEKGYGLIEFIAAEPAIREYIQQGYTNKSIYELFIRERKITMSYVHFNRFIKESVAKKLKELARYYPDRDIVICADNDHTAAKNVGVAKAQKAAQAVSGHVIVLRHCAS